MGGSYARKKSPRNNLRVYGYNARLIPQLKGAFVMLVSMPRSIFVATVMAGMVAVSAGQARADQHRFIGMHPIPGEGPATLCHIHAPHVHAYAPVKVDVLYRDYDGWAYFVGDPVAYGYEGDTHVYVGAHPIAANAVVTVDVDVPAEDMTVYCYMKGPHYHGFVPPPDAAFEVKADAHFYVGDYPKHFHRARPKLARINVIYEPIVYTRPVVEVTPPAGYHDVFVEVSAHPGRGHGPPPHARGGGRAHVGGGLSLDVSIPVPTVEVSVGGGVVVHDHHHHRKHKHRKHKHRKHKHRHRH